MQKFLDHFTDYYLKQYAQNTGEHLLILPSKRSVAALKYTFAKQPKVVWLPEIIDIVSFIEKISALEIIDHQEALMLLYKINNQTKEKLEAFETFYSWGSVLLADFNEIDRFLIDTKPFFEHHKAIKEINYFGEEKTELIKSYIAFWTRLPKLYDLYTKLLLEENKAYQGLAYRQASENIEGFFKDNPDQKLIFLGFNALNKAEEIIIETALKLDKAKIAWDIDAAFLKEKHHPANYFIKNYQNQWSAYKERFITLESLKYEDEKFITVIPTPKTVGQAKAVAGILKTLQNKQIENTAIIINDENLISPILNSIPKSIKEVNITMGLSLQQSPVSHFFEHLFVKQKQKTEAIKYSFLKSLFSSEVFLDDCFKQHVTLLSYLEDHQLTSISYKDLMSLYDYSPALRQVLNCLKKHDSSIDFIATLLATTDVLLNHIQNNYKVYFLSYQLLCSELLLLLKEEKDLSLMAAYLLFKDMQRKQKLSFKGSKTKGLQIMGMLESRLLDFENIIMTSVNEGVLPAGKTDNSYMTFNLKKSYGLPTHTEKDAIYAYHFFRLLQRAKHCYLTYDNDQTGFNKGDKSRFISYLEVFKQPNHNIKTKPFSLSTTLESKKWLEIKKTDDVMAALHEHAKTGFSPTALSAYISNPIKFYKKYVLKVKEAKTIDEVIDSRDYGTVMHHTIEKLYKQINQLNPETIASFENQFLELVKTEFDEIYVKNAYQSGQNRLQFEIAKTSLERFFKEEKQKLTTGQVNIIEIEKDIQTVINTKNHEVKLKGQIDRVDTYKDVLRIVDLKTGSVTTSKLRFDDFDDIIKDEEKDKVFQTLFYAYLYAKNHHVGELQAGIISFKNLDQWFMPVNQAKNTTINKEFLNNFEEKLFELIDEILDPNVPFLEKESIFDS